MKVGLHDEVVDKIQQLLQEPRCYVYLLLELDLDVDPQQLTLRQFLNSIFYVEKATDELQHLVDAINARYSKAAMAKV